MIRQTNPEVHVPHKALIVMIRMLLSLTHTEVCVCRIINLPNLLKPLTHCILPTLQMIIDK